jgi:hypothetical protein
MLPAFLRAGPRRQHRQVAGAFAKGIAPNQHAAMMFFPHFLGDAQTRVNYGTRSALTLTAQIDADQGEGCKIAQSFFAQDLRSKHTAFMGLNRIISGIETWKAAHCENGS